MASGVISSTQPSLFSSAICAKHNSIIFSSSTFFRLARPPATSPIRSTTTTDSATAEPLLSNMWKEIQGSSNWENLLEPLNPLLRNEIIRYGHFANVCYKAFDQDPTSSRYLNCKYGKTTILNQVLGGAVSYKVTTYLYATPDVTIPSRWIGYVAVTTEAEARRIGRKDIMVAFRGTVTNAEWLANFMSSLTPARLDFHNPRPDIKVASGFLTLYTSEDSTSKFGKKSCREQVLSEVSRLIDEEEEEEEAELNITLTGHSMGSSLAFLLGYDLAELLGGRRSHVPIITVYSFAGPRVGNLAFKKRCEELGVKVLRVVNVKDPVTKVPGVLFNENFSVGPWSFENCYAHAGVEVCLEFSGLNDPVAAHDLDQYIRLLRCEGESTVVVGEEERKEEEGGGRGSLESQEVVERGEI